MSRILNSVLLALLLLGVASCKRSAPELVYENYEFKPDKAKALERDKIKKPPVDLLTQYIYFKDNNQERKVEIQVDGDTEKLIAPEPVKVVVSTSFPAKEAFKAKLAVMTKEQYPASYTQVFMEGAKELPSTVYQLGATELSFGVGEKKKELELTFNEAELLKLSTEEAYALPLVVSVPDATGIIEYNYFQLTVTLEKLAKLADMENIALVSTFPSDFSIMPHEHITAKANYAEAHAYKVADGKTNHNWWVKSGSSSHLNLTFPKTLVKGVMITSANWKYLSGVSLLVSNNGGKDMARQGAVQVDSPSNKMLIKFNTPS